MKREVLGIGHVVLVAVVLIPALQPLAVSQDAATASAHHQYKVLYAFQGQEAPNGATPQAYVIPDPAGNLYGTTTSGGEAFLGVVFKLDKSGLEYTLVHNFAGYPSDGGNSAAGLIQDATGALYGTTIQGGLKNPNGDNGFGTVFKVDATGVGTVLHSFDTTDGAFPVAAVVLDTVGNLYGTTQGCRAAGILCADFYGEVFKLHQNGKITILHRFTSEAPGSDGAIPQSGLVQDAAGNLYGTTLGGGTAGHGTVFKIDTKGRHTVLHSFTGGPDGKWPQFGNLILDANGNLYGATSSGVIFKLSLAGKFTTLYTFKGGKHGDGPNMPLVRDAAGNIYGTTVRGGDASCEEPQGCGTIFKLDTGGKLTVLHNFTSSADGANPAAGLIEDAAGNLYGTTEFGGNANVQCGNETTGCGTVFRLTP